jgi:transcriptional regulator with XRE-family HTH domain
MAVIRSALPDVERPTCGVCEGRGKRRVNGPRCPNCQGTGVEPRRIGPRPSAEAARPIFNELANLGDDLAEWRFAKVEGAAETRESIRAQIRKAVRRGAELNLTAIEMAAAVGVSRQQLDNICNDDTTGRHRTRDQRLDYRQQSSQTAANQRISQLREQLQAQLRIHLRRISASYLIWQSSDALGADQKREAVYEAIRSATQQSREAGMSRAEIAETLGISTRQLSKIMSDDSTERAQ